MRYRCKLQTKITLMAVTIVMVSITLLTSLTIRWTVANVHRKVEANILNLAKLIVTVPQVVTVLERGQSDAKLQHYVETVLRSVRDVELIVIADMQGIRYAHPNPRNIGKRFVGGDEKRVLQTGQSYISEAVGTMGKSRRAFVPVYDPRGRQIGFVMVGELTRSIDEAKRREVGSVLVTALLSLGLGTLGAFWLARHIKKTLLGLEPEAIAKLYTEKNAMLNAIHEGIIAIDSQKRVTLVNQSALQILKIPGTGVSVIGQKLEDLIPASPLSGVLESGVAEYDREQTIGGTVIVANRVPIKEGAKIVGALATFRDKTIVARLAEEITGVNQIIEAMRANTHEFMNKLHVILGLIRLGEPDEAKDYILKVTQAQQQIVGLVMNKIKDPTIAGLLLGKLSRARELEIRLEIDAATDLGKRNDNITNELLIVIIGNLTENALEAVNVSRSECREVRVRIQEFVGRIEIEVTDTGNGIDPVTQTRIFERGFTTKQGSRGIGLALVREAVERVEGTLELESEEGRGTRIKAVLPRQPIESVNL